MVTTVDKIIRQQLPDHIVTETLVRVDRVVVLTGVHIPAKAVASTTLTKTPKFYTPPAWLVWYVLSKVNASFEPTHLLVNTQLTVWDIVPFSQRLQNSHQGNCLEQRVMPSK